MPLSNDDRARRVVKLTCDYLGMSYAEYARQENINPQHLVSFQAGVDSTITLEPREIEQLALSSAELQEGLNWDVWEAKMKGRTPPKTLVEAWQED